MKDEIFEGRDEGNLDGYNDRSVNGKTKGEFVSFKDANNEGRTNSEIDKTNEGEIIMINNRKPFM